MWIGTVQVAELLGCSRRLVQKSLATPAAANRRYGPGNWRNRSNPISDKVVYQVRRARVLELIENHGKAITSERPDDAGHDGS